jgi:DNA-binding MarR family transcriptional regulator
MDTEAPERAGAGRSDHGEPGDLDEVAARLRTAVTRLNRRLRQESLAGLSPAQASALGMVNKLRTPTLGELALAEQVQPPTMTRVIASMESAGLVVRITDAADRRICRVRLTAHGQRTMQRIRTLKNAYLTRGLARLDPDERAAAAALTGLLERLGEPQ